MKVFMAALAALFIVACGSGTPAEEACSELLSCNEAAYADEAACVTAIEGDTTYIDCVLDGADVPLVGCVSVLACSVADGLSDVTDTTE